MTNRLIQRTAALAIVMVIGGLSGSGLARAQSSPVNDGFGRHVASCARDGGFDGAHNPSVHRGPAGWDGGHCTH